MLVTQIGVKHTLFFLINLAVFELFGNNRVSAVSDNYAAFTDWSNNRRTRCSLRGTKCICGQNVGSLQSAERSALSAVSACVSVKRNDVKANIWILLLDRLRSLERQRDECS